MEISIVKAIVLGMGCFWGAEKRMSVIPGVINAESGYANGEIEGCYEAILSHERLLQRGLSTQRNHAEVVKVSYDPERVDLETILGAFWENHDPTQGNRQGNDLGSNYRSAIYTTNAEQQTIAQNTRRCYQQALTEAGYGRITTEIEPLRSYFRAEEVHQDYLKKNPFGYCGLGGTGIPYPFADKTTAPATLPKFSLIAFLPESCVACERFHLDIIRHWRAPQTLLIVTDRDAPNDVALEAPISITPTIVLLKNSSEVSRFTGYNGEPQRFWRWLGRKVLSPEQQRIAFDQGTEKPFTGAHLHEKRPGHFIDPLTGATLFRSEAKFDSGCGWPSFFAPIDDALVLREDASHGMHRIEVLSASSGIHLGHVFDDGPQPTGKRFCINGNVLDFVPDKA